MAHPLRAALYLRVSTEEQAREGFSISAQKKALLSFCEAKGWNTAGIYIDEGKSGKNTDRPAFQKMYKDACRNVFDVVLVWKINRLSRKNSDLLNILDYLNMNGINLVSFSEQFDASTPAGKLMLSLLGSIGEFERDNIIENIRAGMEERANQGLFNGGKVLGYDTVHGKLVVNNEEALTIRRIFELYLNGCSLKCIQKVLSVEGRNTKNKCQFNISSISRILKNPIYAGYITYNKTKKINGKVIRWNNPLLVQGCHEPIVSYEQFETAAKMLSSKWYRALHRMPAHQPY